MPRPKCLKFEIMLECKELEKKREKERISWYMEPNPSKNRIDRAMHERDNSSFEMNL
jgi:hypothetical protein